MMHPEHDFTETKTDQLKRLYRFHDNDRGTTSMVEEVHRQYCLQAISAELTRRGIELDDELTYDLDKVDQKHSAQMAGE